MVMSDLTNPMFADEVKAREWLEAGIWQDGPICSACGVVKGATLMRCKLYRTSRRRSGRNVMAPTPLRPSIAQWWSRSPGCCRAVHAALADLDQTREAIYEAVRVAAVTRAMTDEGATVKAIGQRIRQSPFNHSIGEYVRGNHTNAIDGHLPIFKRGCKALPTEKELASCLNLVFIHIS
jgi:hypothetical protein